MTFIEYCESKNIHLLRDDIRFIRFVLKKLPADRHKSIMRRYCDEWCKGMDECENAIQKENQGRNRANKYINSLV